MNRIFFVVAALGLSLMAGAQEGKLKPKIQLKTLPNLSKVHFPEKTMAERSVILRKLNIASSSDNTSTGSTPAGNSATLSGLDMGWSKYNSGLNCYMAAVTAGQSTIGLSPGGYLRAYNLSVNCCYTFHIQGEAGSSIQLTAYVQDGHGNITSTSTFTVTGDPSTQMFAAPAGGGIIIEFPKENPLNPTDGTWANEAVYFQNVVLEQV